MRNQRLIPDKWELQNQPNNNENDGIYTYTYIQIGKINIAQQK